MKLLETVFETINESGLDYCIQNKYEMMPEEIPSDIDMMYRGADENFLDKLVVDIAKATKLIITQKITQGYYEYTYILSYPAPEERFMLQLDFYRAISIKGYLNVMPAEDMLTTKRFYKCFYVPDHYIELKYMWIRRTIKKDLKEEHIKIAEELYKKNPTEYRQRLENDFGTDAVKLMLSIMTGNSCKQFYDNIGIFQKSVKSISKKNSSLYIHIKSATFKVFTVFPKRLIRKSGISIAFLSPDGGGKSTVINSINKTVSGSFYGIKTFYMRPRLLKNLGHYNMLNQTEESQSNPDPHGKKLHNPIKSLLRFSFYNLDYILGTWLKITPLKVKKKLVIFDRYYYDYYVDLKRYQYNLPKWLPKALAWSIPKPDMVFVLDADPEVLYKRKQELPIDELTRQVTEYRKIGHSLKNAYIIDALQPIDKVTEDVTRQILLYKARQTAKLMKIKLDGNGML